MAEKKNKVQYLRSIETKKWRVFPSNCHQVEKRETCSEKQNKVSYEVRLLKKKKKTKGQDKE